MPWVRHEKKRASQKGQAEWWQVLKQLEKKKKSTSSVAKKKKKPMGRIISIFKYRKAMS